MYNENFIFKFLKDIKIEFIKGLKTLIGWSIPVVLIGLLFTFLSNITINNKLNVNNFQLNKDEITDNLILDGNEIEEYGVSRRFKIVGESGPYASFTLPINLKGQGNIEKAYIAYQKTERENFIISPVKLEKHLIKNINRIFKVNPSNIDVKITLNFQEKDKFRRAYIILIDENLNLESAYIRLDEDGENILIENINDIFSLDPYDPDLKNTKYYYETYNYLEIQEDYSTILKELNLDMTP